MSEVKTMRIKIEDLIVDPSIEIRSEERSKEVIEGLSEARDGLPPIVVDQNNRVIDGIHRLEAHKLNGDEEVDAEVIVAADDISAIMIALRRNSTHGVKLSGKSRKANAIRLFDAGKSIPEIGEALGVSNRSVDRYLDAEKARIKEKQQRDVVHLYQTGMEMQDIADAISGEGIRTITRSTVSRYVGDYLRKEIADRLEEGWDIDGIEKSLQDEGFGRYLKDNPNLLQEVADLHSGEALDTDSDTEARRPSEGFGSPEEASPAAESGEPARQEHAEAESGDDRGVKKGVKRDDGTSRTKHKDICEMLLWIGQLEGLQLWLGKSERSKQFKGDDLARFSSLLQDLPADNYGNAREVIEQIDVLWLDAEKIVAAFEVENTTPHYSGLLRMSDLILLRESVRIHVVSPHNRRRKAVREIDRPTFSKLKLKESCKWIPYDVLEKTYEESKRSTLSNNWQAVLDEIAQDL